MCLSRRMYDTQESGDSGTGGRHRCPCRYCSERGCSCTDTGSHGNCSCSRCGDGSGADWQGRKGGYE